MDPSKRTVLATFEIQVHEQFEKLIFFIDFRFLHNQNYLEKKPQINSFFFFQVAVLTLIFQSAHSVSNIEKTNLHNRIIKALSGVCEEENKHWVLYRVTRQAARLVCL